MSHVAPPAGFGALRQLRIDLLAYTEGDERVARLKNGRHYSTTINPQSRLWRQTCNILAAMANLRSLTLRMTTYTASRDGVDFLHRNFLDPTTKLDVPQFEVYIGKHPVADDILSDTCLKLHELDKDWDHDNTARGYIYTRPEKANVEPRTRLVIDRAMPLNNVWTWRPPCSQA